jgi:23S rRNA (uracil1939-C5)-methyltransferase
LARSGLHRQTRQAPPSRRVLVRIDEIGAGGDGVAIIDNNRVYTPLTAPGDLALIDASGERGTLVALEEKSAVRAQAPCRHYGDCGGCALQHVTPEYYRDWKRARIADALTRESLGHVVIAPTIETPAASRRRAVFAVVKSGAGVVLGFNRRRSSQIVDVEGCLVLDPDLAARLPALRAIATRIAAPQFDLAATLCDNGLDVSIRSRKASEPRGAALAEMIDHARQAGIVRLSLNGETIALISPLAVKFGGVAVTPPPGGFLQASREGEAALIAIVKDAATGAAKIADLFCGCGTFALPLAQAASVYAVDADSASVAALARAAGDAQRSGVKVNPVTAETRDLFERPLSAKELRGFDAIVFDPPRAGAELQAQEISRSDVATIIGVSCNPVTFARDAAILVAAGYSLSQVTPVDQFVYSPHIELVGLFHKKPGRRG